MDGYERITNIDISGTCIAMMRERCKHMVNMRWMVNAHNHNSPPEYNPDPQLNSISI